MTYLWLRRMLHSKKNITLRCGKGIFSYILLSKEQNKVANLHEFHYEIKFQLGSSYTVITTSYTMQFRNLGVQRNITQNYSTNMDLHFWNLVKNLTVAQLVKKFPVTWNLNFSNIFATTCHWSLSWASWSQLALSYTISFKLASVLSCYPYIEF